MMAAFVALVMWFKLFYLLRFSFRTAFFVRMNLEISKNMKTFVFVFFIAIGAFAHGFYLLSLNHAEGTENFVGKNFAYAFACSYKMGRGNFNTADFTQPKNEGTALTMWLLATLVMTVVLLNMLIAVMGDNFNRVQEQSDGSMLMEVAGMMQENAFLLNRAKIFHRFRYIFVVSTEQSQEERDSWESRVETLKTHVSDLFKEQEKRIVSIERNV